MSSRSAQCTIASKAKIGMCVPRKLHLYSFFGKCLGIQQLLQILFKFVIVSVFAFIFKFVLVSVFVFVFKFVLVYVFVIVFKFVMVSIFVFVIVFHLKDGVRMLQMFSCICCLLLRECCPTQPTRREEIAKRKLEEKFTLQKCNDATYC